MIRFLLSARYLVLLLLFLCREGECGYDLCSTDRSSNTYIFGSLLYWKTDMEELEFAMSRDNEVVLSPLNISSEGQIIDLNYEWRPGVRGGIGYSSPCNGWTVQIEGTYSYCHAENSKTVDSLDLSVEQLAPLWFPGLMGFTCQTATAEWGVNFTTVDLSFAKVLYSCDCFSWLPFAGLRFASIEQKYNGSYDGSTYLVVDSGGLVTFNKDNDFHLKSRYHAFGIALGSDFNYQLKSCVDLKAALSGSFVYGKQNNQTRVNGGFPSTITGSLTLTPIDLLMKETPDRMIYNIEYQLGGEWTVCDYSHCSLVLSASYICSIWFNMNPFSSYSFSADPTGIVGSVSNSNSIVTNQLDGNLQMHGLVLDASIRF